MASPWKFFCRLISPGRQLKREIGSTEKVTPEALPISGPTEAPAEESVEGADRPVSSEELPRHGQAAAISAEPVHSDEAKNGARDKVERRAAKIGQVANQALSGGTGIDVTAAHVDTTHIRRTVEVAPRKEEVAARKR
ncbi:hypothetical protein [Rhizobium leguminosarum]|uniref:hypothetical protein n=1 Tax=Rhizobium leguminosarum TaxID=384 RepID=UPI001FDFA47F|nr:hypothetical protein [Rhizobium leguminosarum]